ncbi:hypothetical protein HRW18_14580 [Streptomyces lunaelactis]|uniref:hypothetical protein n=1 Tax=Streptomyces lunaelactis TaxID=1535768 RepID=UPI001585A3FE|nr:hypothetical protein [Streptomyces lunaelactis]NUK05841.1 hypothetical protein [Streptomyces lunaelactis]NUK09206.1 hypothetical protein [Streptomyces lunaelactis]NUK16357.1 hypothetical protein [Streptomyces lunaelactis]NUK32330.1 hypothetical protein [Streptomyces lunaelactis]NUK40360.1 hypothetical protein [Streptomyces lunaelactis]
MAALRTPTRHRAAARRVASYAVTAKSSNGDVDVDVPTDGGSAHIVTARSDNGKVTVRSAN